MHKRTIALAAAALLMNGAAINQASAKQPRSHRAAATEKKTADAARPQAQKPA